MYIEIWNTGRVTQIFQSPRSETEKVKLFNCFLLPNIKYFVSSEIEVIETSLYCCCYINLFHIITVLIYMFRDASVSLLDLIC